MFELLVPSHWHWVVEPLGSGVSVEEVGDWRWDYSLSMGFWTVLIKHLVWSVTLRFCHLKLLHHDEWYFWNWSQNKLVLLKLLWLRCFTATARWWLRFVDTFFSWYMAWCGSMCYLQPWDLTSFLIWDCFSTLCLSWHRWLPMSVVCVGMCPCFFTDNFTRRVI